MVIRRKFTPEFKAQVVLEVISGVNTAAEAYREYRLKPQVLSRWKNEFLENGVSTILFPLPQVSRGSGSYPPQSARMAMAEANP